MNIYVISLLTQKIFYLVKLLDMYGVQQIVSLFLYLLD